VSPPTTRTAPEPESPVRSLFAGRIPEDSVFPFPAASPEERETVAAFLDSFRAFARDRIDPDRIEREQRISEDVIRGLAELGAFGMTVPEQFGGYGFSTSAYCRVMEEVGGTDASLGILLGGHQSIGMKGVVLFGSEEQKRRWLPDLAAGRSIAAFALTEPEAGSDAASIRSTAELDPAGGHFALRGNKHWISNGGIADFFTVFARDPALGARNPHEGITAFGVTKDLGGVVPGSEERKLGLKGSSTVALELRDVRVPAGNVLGERGRGFKIAVEILNTGRTSLAAGCIGAAKRMIRAAAEHATQRRQFGSRIAEFEMVRSKFARMVVSTYALESMVYLTAGLIDRGLADYSLEGACCKIFGTESVWQTINDALQIAGGNGFMEEYPFGRALRDARVNMIFEGTNEILRALVSLSGMRDAGEDLKEVARALKAPFSSLGILSDYAARRIRGYVARGRVERVAPELEAEGQIVCRYAAAAAHAAEMLLRRHGKEILARQYQQERLADVVIALYASLATLARATATASEGAARSAEEIRLARRFVRGAKYRIVGALKSIHRGDDEDRTAISTDAYAALGYPLPGIR
jgi:acyl-CoA dehydrogenase family member 9